MKNAFLKDFGWLLLAIIVVGLSCLYAWGYRNGVKSVKVETKIEYIKGKTIHDTIYLPKPYKEIAHDTITFEKFKTVDTNTLYEIWRDYNTEKSYNLDFSNDTLGVFKVDVDITKNSLVKALSTIQPIIRIERYETVVSNKNTIRGYGVIGSSIDFQTNQIEIGAELFDRYLVGVSGIRNNNKVYFTINAGFKF